MRNIIFPKAHAKAFFKHKDKEKLQGENML